MTSSFDYKNSKIFSDEEDSELTAFLSANIENFNAYIADGNPWPMPPSARIGVFERIRKNGLAKTKIPGSIYYESLAGHSYHYVIYRSKAGNVYTWITHTIDYKTIYRGTVYLYSQFVDGNDVLDESFARPMTTVLPIS
jgi:hypothetical protein